MSKMFALGTTALLLTLAAGHARADKQVPIWEQDPDDQYRTMQKELSRTTALMDQYGDKINAYARWGYVQECLWADGDQAQKTIRWALCREDLAAVAPATIKEHGKFGWEDEIKRIDELKKAGAELEEEAKTDPGLAAILKQAEAAKADWKTFEATNHDAIVLYQKLKAGVRTSKSNAPQFDGCWDATQPAFAKAVRATKFSWDNDGEDAVPGRVAEIVTTPANYYAVANFAMCAYAIHATGAVLAGSAVDARGGVFGWRTMLIAKLLDPQFKPKFSDRSLTWTTSEFGTTKDITKRNFPTELQFPWPPGSMKYDSGTIGTLKKDGDDTLVTFKAGLVDGCLNWKETNKLRTWDTAGDPVYERVCTKRGKVQEDAADDTTFGTKFTDGFAPGIGVAFIGSFPIEVYNKKTSKFVSILGVSVKGSPAETPRKE